MLNFGIFFIGTLEDLYTVYYNRIDLNPLL